MGMSDAEILRAGLPAGAVRCGVAAIDLPALPGMTRVLCAAFPYLAEDAAAPLCRYARCKDYHAVLAAALEPAAKTLRDAGYAARILVDASPIPEVETAVRAGLGVRGKNGLLIVPEYGSWVFIGCIATDAPLMPTPPEGSVRCIGCDACIRACPTGALTENGVDAARCLSAVTQRGGDLTDSEKAAMRGVGTMWGCDRCQEVCPENRGAKKTAIPAFRENLLYELTPGMLEGLTNRTLKERWPDRAFTWRGAQVLKRNAEILSKQNGGAAMLKMNFDAHNEEVKRVWDAYNAGNPIRMPVILGINPRVWLLDPTLNTEQISFERYFADPAVMLDVVLRTQDYTRHNLIADHPMGLPREGWQARVDLQNIYEAAWLGAKVLFPAHNCPYADPFLTDGNRADFLRRPIPGAFDGIFGQALSYYEYFLDRIHAGYEYRGVPLTSAAFPIFGTDGPMTVACNLRGTDAFCIDLIEEPDFADELLCYITESIIGRIKAQRRAFGLPERAEGYGFADDDVALLSCGMYEERILPHHKRMVDELGTPGVRNSIHLCGDATRHFRLIRDALNVYSFDTGFPVRHGELVRTLGTEVRVNGGVRVNTLLAGTQEEVFAEASRIRAEVEPYTRRFVMREANNLSPCTPPENLLAMYRAVGGRVF